MDLAQACAGIDSPGISSARRHQQGYAQVSKSKRKATRHKPITAHRLFPAFAGLWFAALFGLVSFALPVGLVQKVVVASGLPHLVAAAAPPLGFTARALVALLLTGVGGMLGLIVGLRLGAPYRPQRERLSVEDDAVTAEAPRVRARDAHPDAPPRRPLTVSADMIDESETAILADDAAPVRRRPLVSRDDAVAPPLAFVPAEADLPGGMSFAPRAFDPFAIYEAPETDDEAFVPPPFLAEALENATRAEPAQEAAVEPELPAEPVVEPEAEAMDAVSDAASLDDIQSDDEPEAPLAVEQATAPAPSLFAMARDAAGEGGRSPVAQADIDGLGLVQLVERLALAIADHRRALDSAMDETARADRELSFSDTPSEPGLSGPALSGPILSGPTQSGPIASGPAVHGDVLAMPRLPRAAAEAAQPGAIAGEPGVLEERYSSLLDMAAAVRRADATRHSRSSGHAASPQPVVIFPGQGRALRIDEGSAPTSASAPFERPYLAAVPSRFQAVDGQDATTTPDAESTEQALRDALATLQRMTAQR